MTADGRGLHGVVVVALALTLVAAAGAGGWAVARGQAGAGGQPPAPVGTGAVPVVRTDVAERRQISGLLGYSGTYALVAPGPGILTRLPAVGSVVSRGEAAYEVDGTPVVLLYGSRPAWRALAAGVQDGADVQQLERNLVALGQGPSLTVDRHFSAATATAVRRWQRAAHLPVTGTVPLGQVIFAAGPVRVSGIDAIVGAPVVPGATVAHGTSRERAVIAQVDPLELPGLRVGQPVVVTAPDGGQPSEGRVTAVGSTAAESPSAGSGGQAGPAGGPATVELTITTVHRLAGFLERAPVEVAVAQQVHRRVLAVPIMALRALPGARYEVVVVGAAGARRHVEVETGLFDETTGVAEVRAPGLAEGDRVEVPRDAA